MKLIADHLLASVNVDPDTAHAQSLLRLPSDSNKQIGAVDRFVAPAGLWDHLASEFNNLDDRSREALAECVKPPLPIFWLECAEIHMGFLFEGDRGIAFGHFFRNPRPKDWPNVMAVAIVNLEAMRSGGRTWEILPAGEVCHNTNPDAFNWAIQIVGNVIAAIGSRRATSVKRSSVTESQAQRAFLRRAGRPRFSYQQVDLIVPRTCIFRDEVHNVRALETMRGHMVIGHWRLIDGVLEPFWRWIEGHERGDRERGWIVKQRNLVYLGGRTRRGFLMPNHSGEPGERRLAVRS